MKELWRKIVTCSILVMLLIGSTVSVTGCKKETPATAEKSTMEEAAQKTGEATKEAGEKVQDAAEDTAEAAEEAAGAAKDEM